MKATSRPRLPPADSPILIHAVSGLGKSTLAARYPGVTHDTDDDLDAMLDRVLPEFEGRARRIAWRTLCRRQPWRDPSSVDFGRWATGRRLLVDSIVGRLRADRPVMVLSNLLMLPWPVARYYGITLGAYAEHWRRIDRAADNQQDEMLNARLEGYAPLERLRSGCFLADQPDIIAWLDDAARVMAL